MKGVFFFLLFIFLNVRNSTSLQFIKPNVLGLEVNGDPMIQKSDVLLHCGDQFEGSEIHWQKNGMTIPDQGNNIIIAIYGMLGGNYTCHNPSGELLNHTLVLVKPVDFEKAILTATDKEFITCVARNYSGPFHCFWKWDSKRNGVVVFVKASRNSQLMNCSLDADNNGLTCEEQQCPSSEEVNRISLTLMVRSQYRLEEHQKTFFIHDIIKPDKVSIVKSKDDEFEWEQPSTWNTPCSYYPLMYEVKVVSHRKDCTHIGNHSEPHYTNLTQYKVNSRKSYTFCVRAQDSLTNQVWSEWSEEKVSKQK
ncbi:interleukin-12 subunit beta [Astyanax mexicanus]|uniref:interleukin-12 subunit beta n=1 Tax=Astyanax mexicanus TaxID=7994 RepID=UPI0020CB2E13|nr:interleukin-12 subunit beta [Astyanax mexicanus]